MSARLRAHLCDKSLHRFEPALVFRAELLLGLRAQPFLPLCKLYQTQPVIDARQPVMAQRRRGIQSDARLHFGPGLLEEPRFVEGFAKLTARGRIVGRLLRCGTQARQYGLHFSRPKHEAAAQCVQVRSGKGTDAIYRGAIRRVCAVQFDLSQIRCSERGLGRGREERGYRIIASPRKVITNAEADAGALGVREPPHRGFKHRGRGIETLVAQQLEPQAEVMLFHFRGKSDGSLIGAHGGEAVVALLVCLRGLILRGSRSHREIVVLRRQRQCGFHIFGAGGTIAVSECDGSFDAVISDPLRRINRRTRMLNCSGGFFVPMLTS